MCHLRLEECELEHKTATLRDQLAVPFAQVNFTEMCSGSEAGSYLRLIDLCITQL